MTRAEAILRDHRRRRRGRHIRGPIEGAAVQITVAEPPEIVPPAEMPTEADLPEGWTVEDVWRHGFFNDPDLIRDAERGALTSTEWLWEILRRLTGRGHPMRIVPWEPKEAQRVPNIPDAIRWDVERA